jgi:hypothetical protein
MIARPRHFKSKTIWSEFFIVICISNLVALLVLAIWRAFTSTTLLFDQFVLLTITIQPTLYFTFRTKIFPELNLSSRFTKFITSLVCALFFFSTFEYAILAVDRSRSLYVFQWVNDDKIKIDQGISIKNVTSIEARDTQAILQRVIEQEKRGLMSIDEETQMVQLTFLGRWLLGSANFLGEIFNLTGWKINSN